MPDPEVLEPEITDAEGEEFALARRLRHPAVPVTLEELAALKGEAIEILKARNEVLEVARLHAIRMTHPEDWVLNKTRDGRVTGYLQDSGCERVRPILGIEIFDVGSPEKVVSLDGKSFAVVISGRGRSRLTRDEIEAVEGIRESTEDFCKDLTGIKQELRVRQAARANLDGRIVRELAGLGSMPLEELERAWKGTDKKTQFCRLGRGFGSQDERLGSFKADVPQVEPPQCPHCKIPLVYRPAKGDRKAFYGCSQYQQHADRKVIVDAEQWVAEQQKKASAGGAKTGTAAKPATGGAARDPGQEG